MTEKRRIRPEDGVIVYLISFLLMQLLTLAVAKTEGEVKIYLSYLIPQVCYIGVSAVFLIATRTEFRFLPRKENLKGWHYGLAVTAALGIFFFALLPNYGLQILFEKIGKTATVTVPALNEAKDYVLCLITLCILPSVGEELVFRKICCDGFSAYGGRIAVVASGVLFGLSHLNLAQTVHQVFLGCLLAYLYMKTENITLTVLVHFVNNVLALFLTSITGAEMWNNITTLAICCVIGFAVLASSVAVFFKKEPPLSGSGGEKPSVFVTGFAAFMIIFYIIIALVS